MLLLDKNIEGLVREVFIENNSKDILDIIDLKLQKYAYNKLFYVLSINLLYSVDDFIFNYVFICKFIEKIDFLNNFPFDLITIRNNYTFNSRRISYNILKVIVEYYTIFFKKRNSIFNYNFTLLKIPFETKFIDISCRLHTTNEYYSVDTHNSFSITFFSSIESKQIFNLSFFVGRKTIFISNIQNSYKGIVDIYNFIPFYKISLYILNKLFINKNVIMFSSFNHPFCDGKGKGVFMGRYTTRAKKIGLNINNEGMYEGSLNNIRLSKILKSSIDYNF